MVCEMMETSDNCRFDEESARTSELLPQVYSKRWSILAVVALATALKSYNQSCFGIINNVWCKYYDVAPWQVDWFVVIQSAMYLVLSLPLAILAKRRGFRFTTCITIGAITLGYAMTSFGVLTRKGYSVVLLGQASMGVGSVLTAALAPAAAALWFPANEVASAVAVTVVAQGIGESLGSITPPFVVEADMPVNKVAAVLIAMFSGLAALAVVLFIYCLAFVEEKPTTPPSQAQAKLTAPADSEAEETFWSIFKKFCKDMKTVFQSCSSVVALLMFGATFPVQRSNSLLLSSMLHQRFTDKSRLNKHAGVALSIAWVGYTVGAFIAGPIITKTRNYKGVVCATMILLVATCIASMFGIIYANIHVIYGATVSQGFILGVASTAAFEFLIEVTYPQSEMFVSLLGTGTSGVFRLLYPLANRMLLQTVGATASTVVPLAISFLLTLVLFFIKPVYRRELANEETDYLLG